MWVIRESWIWASSNVNSPLVKTQSGQKTGQVHIYTCINTTTTRSHRRSSLDSVVREHCITSFLKLNSCYELRLQSIERFINYCNTSAVFFFIDDSCFSDEVQCIKSERSTVSDGLTVGQRKQPMCSNAVSLFPVIAIIICHHSEEG